MKRWIIVTIVAGIVLLIVGYLFFQGEFDEYSWESVSIVIAALIAPVKWVVYWIKGDEEKSSAENLNKQIENMEKKRKEEALHQEKLLSEIKDREQQTQKLEKDLELLKANLEILEERRKKVQSDIYTMNREEADQKINQILQ